MFRLESQYFLFRVTIFGDENHNNKSENWPLSGKHDGVGFFHIYECTALHKAVSVDLHEKKEWFLDQATQDLAFNILNNRYISKHLPMQLQRIPDNFIKM